MSDRALRRVFLLAPNADGTLILVDDTGNLPSFVLALEADETTVGLAWNAISELGVHASIVDCAIDQTPQPDGVTAVVPAVIELTALDSPLPGCRWTRLAHVEPAVGLGLAGHVADRFAELRGLRAVPAARAAWCRPGWYDRVCAWVDAVLVDRGERPAVKVTPHRQWGTSAVLRVQAETTQYWFKAAATHFASEPIVTEFLDRHRPGRVPRVIAVEPEQHWMLLEEISGATAAAEGAATPAAIAALVELQRGFIGHTQELLAGGFDDRPLGRLPDQVLAALDLPLVHAELHVDAHRAADLVTWLADAVAAVQAIGIPHTLVHGDFHPGNVIRTEDGVVLFDWSDAAVAHPLVDVAVWASWSREDPEAVDGLWRAFADAWSDVADPDAVIAARRSLDAVTGAYHFVSYARILDALEPSRRPELLDGLTGFFELFDHTLPLDPAR